MAISYLSQKIAPGVIPEQIPLELVAQVAAQKQNKYDQVLDSVFAQYNNLLGLDASSNREANQLYNSKMEKSEKDLVSVSKLDLLNPDNGEKINNIFNPILNDENIMGAVYRTKVNNEVNTTYKNWLKKGSDDYSEKNYRDSLEQQEANRNMSLEDFSKKPRNITATPYKDVNAHLVEQAQKIPAYKDLAVTESGAFYLKSTNEGVAMETILNMLDISGPYLSQMEINARQEYKNTPAESILGSMMERTGVNIKSYEKVNAANIESIKITDININKLEKETPDAPLSSEMLRVFRKQIDPELEETTTNKEILTYLRNSKKVKENNIEQNKESITRLNDYNSKLLKQYGGSLDGQGNVVLSQPLDFDNENFLKTQFGVLTTKERVAEGMAYKQQSLEMTQNPEYMERIKFNNSLIKAEVDSLLKIEEERAKNGGAGPGTKSDPKNPNQLTETTNGIKTPGEKLDNFTYGEKQKAILNEIEKLPDTFAEELFLNDPEKGTNFESLSDNEKLEYRKQAEAKLDEVAKVYGQLQKDVIQTGWGKNAQAVSTSDFIKENKRAIQYYESQQNLINSQKLMNNIKKNIDEAVPLKASQEFVEFLSTQPYITLDMKTFGDNLIDINNLGFAYKILLPPDMQENIKKQGINGFNLKKIYDYNIAEGNNPKIGSLNIAGGRPILSDKIATYEEFENIVMNRDINTNNTKWSDFDPLNSIFGDRNDQLELQSTTLIVPSFNVIPKSDTFTDVSSTAQKAVKGLYQTEINPAKISSLEIFRDPQKGWMMNVSIPKDTDGEAQFYENLPIAQSVLKDVKGLEDLVSISEIQKGVDIMVADANARQNSNYVFKDVKKTLPESTFYYGGKKFSASINPDKSPLKVTIKSGSSNVDLDIDKVTDYFYKNHGFDKQVETDFAKNIRNIVLSRIQK